MKTVELTIPEVALMAATRAMTGAGVALLLANKLSKRERRAVGAVLVAAGIVTTVPLMAEIFGKMGKGKKKRS